MLAMTATDLLGFAAMHLAGGQSPDGQVILSRSAAAAMQVPQVSVPRVTSMGDQWGLGWELFTPTEGPAVIGHDGGTIGQSAFLRVVPEAGVAVALLTNGGHVLGLYQDVVEAVLAKLAGVTLPARPAPPTQPQLPNPTRYTGLYSDTIYSLELSRDDQGRLWLLTTPKDVQADLVQERPERVELTGLDTDRLITVEPKAGVHRVYAFLGDDGTGRAEYIHYGRAVRRQADHQQRT
jgi:hypothetical protein